MPKRTKPAPFKDDWRQKNPGLHLLYTKWALVHLKEVERTMKRFAGFCNFNMMDIMVSIERERNKLIRNNAAYAEAAEMLDSLRPKHKRA